MVHESPSLFSFQWWRREQLLGCPTSEKSPWVGRKSAIIWQVFGTGIPLNSLKRYLALLQAVFIYEPIPPWHVNFGKRLVKSPKSCLLDTGLACHLLQIGGNISNSAYYGRLLETFVITELRKQLTWNSTRCYLYHWRTHEGDEVDVVLESGSGTIVALEVKATSTISTVDINSMSRLARLVGSRFHRGILLYQGQKIIPFAKNILALPISTLWRSVPAG